MRPTQWMRTVLCTLVLILSMGAASAQDTTGSISGTITDSSGAAIKGATVTLINSDRNAEVRTLKTNNDGYFTATSLPLGTYNVKVTGSGFKTESVTGLVLHVNDALTLNRSLVPGSVSEVVTVQADQVQLNLENGTSAGLITGEQIREMALNNRNYEQLILLQPGVSYGGASDQLYIGASLPSGTSAQVSFSVNGGRNTSNNWTIDGADNVDRGANLTLLAYPSVDAIAEFKTLRGTYTAEFGRSASGQINVVTKSGTNSFHGSAYEFFRNDIFNANNYFNKLTTPNTRRSQLRYNDFGYTIGGPVWIPGVYNGKDKTFFFFSEELRRVINYSTPTTTFLPLDYELAGDFSNAYLPVSASQPLGTRGPVNVCFSYNTANGQCTGYTNATNGYKVPISAGAASYIALYKKLIAGLPTPFNPAGNIAAGLDPHSYISSVKNTFNNNQVLVRIDQQVGTKLNVFYRYLHDTLPSIEGGGLFVGTNLPGLSITSTRAPGTQHMGHVTWTVTPTTLVNGGYAYSYGALLSTPTGLVSSANSPDIHPTALLNTNTPLGVIPSLSITNFSGISSAGNYYDINTNHNAFGDVTKVIRKMTIIAGVTYNNYSKQENALNNGAPYPAGNFAITTPTYAAGAAPPTTGPNVPTGYSSAFSDFLLGNINSSFQQGSSDAFPTIKQNLIEAYVQDNWKVFPRLTLNLGVRYSYFAQPTDGSNRLSNFNPDSYVAANAPTVGTNGLLCTTATQGLATNGCTSGKLPNPTGDPLNGYILGTPGSFGHASPWGNKVGQADKLNFAPRFGFAYDVFGTGKTAFRGGYGLAYDQSSVSYYETSVFNNAPYVIPSTCSAASFDLPSSACASATPIAVYGSPIRYKTPYTMQYSLDIQQSLGSNFAMDIGYFGTRGVHLLGKVDINEIQPGLYATKGILPSGTGFTSTASELPLNQIRPYVGYNAINTVRSIFSSNYNALQVKVTKKFSGKSLIDANYTWSRALTNSQNDYSTSPQNTYNINADYGRAALDRTNILTLDGIWELPWYREQKGIVGRVLGGWEVTGIYTVNSGLPLTPSMSGGSTVQYNGKTSLLGATNGGVAVDSAGLGILGASASGLRPDMNANPNNGYGTTIHTRLNWFNQTVFTATPQSAMRPGNSKRGIIEGPGYNRLDVGLFRNFKITERVDFQLRGEAFNVANHTNWQGVGTTATATTFGQITSTRDPRILQVAGKVRF